MLHLAITMQMVKLKVQRDIGFLPLFKFPSFSKGIRVAYIFS